MYQKYCGWFYFRVCAVLCFVFPYFPPATLLQPPLLLLGWLAGAHISVPTVAAPNLMKCNAHTETCTASLGACLCVSKEEIDASTKKNIYIYLFLDK